MVWYSHLLKNFPQFVLIHTVKDFGVVNKAEIDVFLELACFFYDPVDVGSLVPLSMGFPRQEYWSGLPFPSPGDLPDPRIKTGSLALAGFFTSEPPGKLRNI